MRGTICAMALSTTLLGGCADKMVGKVNVEYVVNEEVPMRVTEHRWIEEDGGIDLCEVYADINRNGHFDRGDVFMGLYQCWSLE